MGFDDLFTKLGPIIQQGAYAACVILALWLRVTLKKNDALELQLGESQKARIVAGENLVLVIERNTVATKELGELVYDLNKQAT